MTNCLFARDAANEADRVLALTVAKEQKGVLD